MYLGKKEPGTAWSLRSRSLAEGLTLYEESINEFGIPLREAYDPERDGWYEVDDTTIDFAVAAMETYRKTTKDQEPGVQLTVKDTWEGEEARPEAAQRKPPAGDATLGDVGTGLDGVKNLSG